MPTFQPVRAPRGAVLSCHGWRQEGALRLLLNSLDPEVAEPLESRADETVRDVESVQSTIAVLRALKNDESLIVNNVDQPGTVIRTTPAMPRVVTLDSARDWLYTGTQTALPLAYALFNALAQKRFGGTLAGRLVVSGGMGGLGGAYALAATLHGAAFLGIDADGERIKRQVKAGYCDTLVTDIDEALRILKNAVRRRIPTSVGLFANFAELIPQLARRGVVPDVLSDKTPSNGAFDGYVPSGLAPEAARALNRDDPDAFRARARDSIADQHRGMAELEKLGALVIGESTSAANNFAGARAYLQSIADAGFQLAIWMALSGEPADIARADQMALETLSDDGSLQKYLPLVSRYVRFQGLPARAALIREADYVRIALALNDLVAQRQLAAPILIGLRQLFGENGKPAPSRAGDLQYPEVAHNLANVLPKEARGAAWASVQSRDRRNAEFQILAKALVADGSADASRLLGAQ
jgi:urocanate hydratase